MATAGPFAVKFDPIIVTDSGFRNGEPYHISVKFQNISCMREYENKSLEELRWEDYMYISKENGGSKTLNITSKPSTSGFNFGNMINTVDLIEKKFSFSKPDNPFGNPDALDSIKTASSNRLSSFIPLNKKKEDIEKKPKFGNSSIFIPSENKFAFGNTNSFSGVQEVVKMGEVENFEFNFSKALKLGPCGDVLDSKTPEEDVKKLVSDLQGLIECPVCLGRLDSSMRQCSNGHGICDSCSNKMRECPLCQSSFLPNKPIMIAKILDRLPKPCSFADKGCDKVSFTGRDEHEAFCKYRTTYCMFMMSGIHCDWSGTVEAVLDHAMLCGKGGEGSISKVYFPSVKVTHVYMFTPAENSTFYSAMVFEDQLFWKYCYRNSTTKMITWRFIHVAPSKPKKKYYLVVSFCKGEIEYKTCVEAYCETNGDQKDYKASLLLTDDSLKRFYDSKAKGYVCSECIVVENIVDEK